MLDSDQAWTAAQHNTEQWMVIDLGKQHGVHGIIVSGRGHPHSAQKVTQIRVDLSDQAYGPWTQIGGEYDCKTVVEHEKKRVMLSTPTLCRYVRINPRAWEGHVSMRCGVLVGSGAVKLE